MSFFNNDPDGLGLGSRVQGLAFNAGWFTVQGSGSGFWVWDPKYCCLQPASTKLYMGVPEN